MSRGRYEEVVGVSDGPEAGRTPAGAGAAVGPPVLSLALATLLEAVHAHSGAVYLLRPDEPVLEMAVTAGMPRAFAAPWQRVGLSAPIPVAEAVRERRVVWVGGEVQMARRYPRIAVVLPYPFALAAAPVATGAKVYGAVFVTWPGAHPPELSEAEREQVTAACERLALRLERAARDRRHVGPEADLLAAPPAGIADSLGSVEATRMVSRLPYGLASLDLHGRIGFVNAAAVELLGRPAEDLLGTLPWVSLSWLNDPMYEDRYRAALISQQVVSFVALRPPGDWLSFRLYPSTSGLSVRVTRARAVTELARAAPEVSPRPARLVTISQVLSLAGALTEAVGVRDVVQLVWEEVVPAVGGQALAVLAQQGGRLHVLGHRGYRDPRVVERFDGLPLTEPTPGTHVLNSGVPAFFGSRAELERLYPNRGDTPDGYAAWAYLPLVASGRPVGTCVLAYAEPHVFPADERAVLTSLGGLIAQALERARLYDAKLRLAHGLQQALLPHSLPALPGIEAAARYLPATHGMEIGGDFYDLVPARPLAAAVIGDVQGHNVTAAALMGQIRTGVRAYTTVGQAPHEVMSSTNRLLTDLGSELFASCLYLRLDPARGRAVMARAGHPPPLLRRPDGRVRVLDLAGGPLLGIDAAAVYPTTEVALAPGSVLVLYTDGLVESPGVDIEDALVNLGGLLSEAGDQPLESLADEILRHSAAARERLDDVAVLLLRAGDR
ncbi:SpoIIE family protein phosphatase [Streptomyces sp. LP11]|uniref:SpoIIE family protein phosphatase n=1 Tax=Streptomyces pyxinicus TaxID=2970331 RepID=A0ABT2BBY8_9ACTN|nr:SpoIIE family protein phosphatase [Streptomyces sp. LP11]MCS0605433.1 SpoIIE family protein phosphatase [Streptomyces sp. LP11]